jgi:glycosyltransferase involved in cell wall biosynthesis
MARGRIKLAVLVQDLEFGGTQRYALNLLTHIDRGTFDPELWVLRGGTDMLELAQRGEIPVVHFSHTSWVGPSSLTRLWLRLRRTRPDVLYTLTVVPNTWGRLLGHLSGVPVIVSSFRNRIAPQFETWLSRWSARIVCNASSLKDMIVQEFAVHPQLITVVPNGVDTDYFSPSEGPTSSDPTVLFVGRFVPQKAPLTLLEGFRLVCRTIPEARLVMIGNGPLKAEAEHFIAAQGLTSHVTLLPGTPDVRSHLRQARVFALASLFEGSPNVMIEAMATGLPVVGTRVDGIPELVTHGRSGLLVEPQDPAALAEALVTLLSDETKCRTMGVQARQKVLTDHSLTHMVRATERVFLECLDQRDNATSQAPRSPLP